MLEPDDRPSAIFAANDVSALATISVARSLGLAVPDDLSVIGFDNVPESALSEPPLTTIEQPIQQMGFDAAQILIRLIDEQPVPTHTMLPTRLVVRGSCRAVRASRGRHQDRQRRTASTAIRPARPTSVSRISSAG